MQQWAKKAGRAATGVLFPDICLSCGAFVSRQGVLCSQCWSDVQFIERPFCEVNGTPFSVEFGPGMTSAAAIANPPIYDAARSCTIHHGISRQLVTRLKYADRTDLAVWMAQWMVRAGSEFFPGTDLIVPVPLHRGRFYVRRFNQSAELARHISSKTCIPMEPAALMRKRATKQQVGLTQSQRRKNVSGAFLVPDEMQILVAGRSILLVDDVLTTGATANAAAKALRKADAASVNVLTFSQVVPHFSEQQSIKPQ